MVQTVGGYGSITWVKRMMSVRRCIARHTRSKCWLRSSALIYLVKRTVFGGRRLGDCMRAEVGRVRRGTRSQPLFRKTKWWRRLRRRRNKGERNGAKDTFNEWNRWRWRGGGIGGTGIWKNLFIKGNMARDKQLTGLQWEALIPQMLGTIS